MDVDLSNISSLFNRRVIEPIARSPTPPGPEEEEPWNHGIYFIACSRCFYPNVLLDPAGDGMWLFDPKIAELRKSNNFLVKIIAHSSTEVADRRDGVVLADRNPPTHPIPRSTPANVTVRYEIKKKDIVREESLPVGTLCVTLPKPKAQHAVIRGEGVGNIVIYLKSDGPDTAHVRKENDRRGGFDMSKADMCVIDNS